MCETVSASNTNRCLILSLFILVFTSRNEDEAIQLVKTRAWTNNKQNVFLRTVCVRSSHLFICLVWWSSDVGLCDDRVYWVLETEEEWEFVLVVDAVLTCCEEPHGVRFRFAPFCRLIPSPAFPVSVSVNMWGRKTRRTGGHIGTGCHCGNSFNSP